MKSRIRGLQFHWRKGKSFDALRVQVYDLKEKKAIWITNTHPILKQINDYLRKKKLNEKIAISDIHLTSLRGQLEESLKAEYGLSSYLAKKKLELKTKEFDYGLFIEKFYEHKKETTAVANNYRGWLYSFWIPYLKEELGCEHPDDFIKYEAFFEDHIRKAKSNSGKPYSPHTYKAITSSFNEWMRFLKKRKAISKDSYFLLYVETGSLEQIKRGKLGSTRGHDYYKEEELFEIKKKIDEKYPTGKDISAKELLENKKWKLRGYAILLGCCMGLRRGNIIGLKAEDLHPENEVPYLITSDNIVSGNSRGEKGALKLENATKTFVGKVELPFIQPSVDLLVELSKYIKKEVKRGSILKGESSTGTIYPDTLNSFWRKLSKRAGFRYVHPHGFKHGYASRGALQLKDWYADSVYMLHRCCMHSKFETTQKYIKNLQKDGFIDNFKFLNKGRKKKAV